MPATNLSLSQRPVCKSARASMTTGLSLAWLLTVTVLAPACSGDPATRAGTPQPAADGTDSGAGMAGQVGGASGADVAPLL